MNDIEIKREILQMWIDELRQPHLAFESREIRKKVRKITKELEKKSVDNDRERC